MKIRLRIVVFLFFLAGYTLRYLGEHPVTEKPKEIFQILFVGTDRSQAQPFYPVIVPIPGVHLFNPEFHDDTNPQGVLSVDVHTFTGGFQPTIYCTTEERVGPGLDAGKWMCHPRVLLTHPDDERCVVYSFGSTGKFGLAFGVLAINPECEVHLFNVTAALYEEKAPELGLSEQVSFHQGYTLVAQNSLLPPVDARPVKFKSLEQIMRNLGHSMVHHVNIDLGAIDLSPGFVDTTEDSAWKQVASLQIEVHPETLDARLLTIGLLKDLRKAGFTLFGNEPDCAANEIAELSFINDKLMERYLDIPYNRHQSEEARSESLRRLNEAPQRRQERTGSVFSLIERSHFGCSFLRPFSEQRSRLYCQTFLHISGERPVAYFFVDQLSPAEEKWIDAFAKDNGVRVFLWSTTEPKSTRLTYRPLSEVPPLATLLAFGVTELMVRNNHKELAMVYLGHPSALDIADNSLKQPARKRFLDAAKAFSRPLQLVLDLSACDEEKNEALARVVTALPDLGYSLLGKRFVTGKRMCDYSFTFTL